MEVPHDPQTGEFREWKSHSSEMREVSPWTTRFQIVGMERGRSAARFIIEDLESGRRYPLFMTGMLSLVQGLVFHGTLEPVKRGANYAVQPKETEPLRNANDDT